MATSGDGVVEAVHAAEADGAADATRADRFIKTAVAILGETGRTDFTVQEVVARSKTSLRAFYQHFNGKDELLLALFDRTIAQSATAWTSSGSRWMITGSGPSGTAHVRASTV